MTGQRGRLRMKFSYIVDMGKCSTALTLSIVGKLES